MFLTKFLNNVMMRWSYFYHCKQVRTMIRPTAMKRRRELRRRWAERLRQQQRDRSKYHTRVKQLESLMSKANPDVTPGAIRNCAQERASLEQLCAQRLHLPSAGLDKVAPMLVNEGFYFGPDQLTLTLTYFPDGWVLRPATSESSLKSASHANLVDSSGRVRANVFFRSTDTERRGHIMLA